MDTNNYIFLLNGKEYCFRKNSRILKKLNDSVSQNFLDYSQYIIKSNVPESTIIDLIDYLTNKKGLPELTIDNYYYFAILNNELNIKELDNLLTKKDYNNV